jgi:hypothetical protein
MDGICTMSAWFEGENKIRNIAAAVIAPALTSGVLDPIDRL